MDDDDVDEDEDGTAHKEYHEKVRRLAAVFRRTSLNIFEEIEKLGFTYIVDDDDDDDDEILEERAARPETELEMTLVSYLEGDKAPSESVLELWLEETQREGTPVPLWRRYFRTGNPQLKKLIVFGLDKCPTTRDLLDDLSVLHSFLPIPKDIIYHFTLACNLEDDPEKFCDLAQDFDTRATSFGYDALYALRASYTDNDVKRNIIDGLLLQRRKHEEGIAF
jgi:hypothetical protein